MKNMLFAVAFASTMLMARPSVAAEQYVYLNCAKGAGDHAERGYSGYAIADKVDFSAAGIQLVGRDHILVKRTIENASCNLWYWESQQDWNGTEWVSNDYKTTRNWNGLEVQKQAATLYLNCGPSSELRVFDTKEVWLNEIYKTVVGTRLNEITNRTCLIDGIN